jgi:hypothetical protein
MSKPRKKRSDIDQVYDGEWQTTDTTGRFTEICCDCSLTHHVQIKVEKDGTIKWRCWRDNKQTKPHRRNFKNTAAKIP